MHYFSNSDNPNKVV